MAQAAVRAALARLTMATLIKGLLEGERECRQQLSDWFLQPWKAKDYWG